MAAPTLGLLNHTELDDADNNTGWNDLTTADTDIKVEGTGSMSGIFRADGEQGYYDHGSVPATAVGKVWRGWIFTNNIAYMGAMGSNAYTLFCYDSSSESNHIDLFGSDTYPGGWFYWWQDMDDFTTVTLANVDRWGIQAGHDSSAKNVINTWMDVMRYLDGYYITGGTTGDRVGLADVLTADKGTTTLYGYGITQEFGGAYFLTGELQIGNGATTTWFEMDGDVFICRAPVGDCTISAGLYTISTNGSGCNSFIRNSVLRGASAGASSRLYLDFSSTAAGNDDFTDNLVSDGGTVQFNLGQAATGNTFDDCLQITHAGADMDDCTVKNYEGTAGTAALVYNINADPDGEMDGMTFEKGTAATHAIEFGPNTPSSVVLRNQTYTGYNAADGQNDSTFYNNTGGALTINISGASGNTTYRNGTSATTSIVSDPVTTTITVVDTAIPPVAISGARVFLETSDGTGSFPFEDSVSITQTGGTATVTHTTHGLVTGNYVVIRGVTQNEYNKVVAITVTTANEYTYAVDSGADSPATGSPVSSAVIISDTTDGSGVASDSRTVGSDTPVKGWARKSSGSPYYVSGTIIGTVTSASGLSITLALQSDE